MAKYYIITKGQEKPFQKLLLAWHTGIDAIEIEGGNFIVGETNIPGLTKYPVNIIINDKEVSAKSEILKCPLLDEKDIVFKQPIAEQEIIKGE